MVVRFNEVRSNEHGNNHLMMIRVLKKCGRIFIIFWNEGGLEILGRY